MGVVGTLPATAPTRSPAIQSACMKPNGVQPPGTSHWRRVSLISTAIESDVTNRVPNPLYPADAVAAVVLYAPFESMVPRFGDLDAVGVVERVTDGIVVGVDGEVRARRQDDGWLDAPVAVDPAARAKPCRTAGPVRETELVVRRRADVGDGRVEAAARQVLERHPPAVVALVPRAVVAVRDEAVDGVLTHHLRVDARAWEEVAEDVAPLVLPVADVTGRRDVGCLRDVHPDSELLGGAPRVARPTGCQCEQRDAQCEKSAGHTKHEATHIPPRWASFVGNSSGVVRSMHKRCAQSVQRQGEDGAATGNLAEITHRCARPAAQK